MQTPRAPIVFEGLTSDTVKTLERERDRLTERIDLLTRNRDAVSSYLSEFRLRADVQSAEDGVRRANAGGEKPPAFG